MPFLPIILLFVTVSSVGRRLHQGEELEQIHVGQKPVVNGFLAKKGQFPFMVGLCITGSLYSWDCGGTIIGHSWVITSALCTDHATVVRIYYGSNEFAVSRIRRRVFPENIFQHPEYNESTLENDISLIHTRYVRFSTLIDKVILGDRETNYTHWWTVACGYGVHSFDSRKTEYLEFGRFQIVGTEYCTNMTGNVSDSQLCGLGRRKRENLCIDDTGGPLITRFDGKLVGISSFIAGDCESHIIPCIFTRVNYFRDWIQEITGIN